MAKLRGPLDPFATQIICIDYTKKGNVVDSRVYRLHSKQPTYKYEEGEGNAAGGSEPAQAQILHQMQDWNIRKFPLLSLI